MALTEMCDTLTDNINGKQKYKKDRYIAYQMMYGLLTIHNQDDDILKGSNFLIKSLTFKPVSANEEKTVYVMGSDDSKNFELPFYIESEFNLESKVIKTPPSQMINLNKNKIMFVGTLYAPEPPAKDLEKLRRKIHPEIVKEFYGLGADQRAVMYFKAKPTLSAQFKFTSQSEQINYLLTIIDWNRDDGETSILWKDMSTQILSPFRKYN